MDSSDDDGLVGYKRPPRHSQFRKGQSGNPRGRPRGAGVRSAVEKVFDRMIAVTVDGERRKVPLTEALVLQLAQKALAGDVTASREILKIADQVKPPVDPREASAKKGPLVILRRLIDPIDCNPSLEALGVIVGVDGQYKIEPWVVEAALARGLVLSDRDRTLVSNKTRRAHERATEQVVDDPRFGASDNPARSA